MPTKGVESASDKPCSRVAAGDPTFEITGVEATGLAGTFVASGVLDQSFRAIGNWLKPAWQGQGSVVRQEGRVKVSADLLRNLSWGAEGLDYALVWSSESPPAERHAQRLVSFMRSRGASLAIAHISQGLAHERIVVPNSQDVWSYLLRHVELARLLPDICAVVRRELGPEVELSLELYTDLEVDDHYLTLYVRKEKYERDILERLQAVSDRFNHRLQEVSGYFLLATDFSRPRGSHAV